MGRFLFSLVIVASNVGTSSAHRETAFGFEKGMTLKQASRLSAFQRAPHTPNLYFTDHAPKPVGPFIGYAIMVSRKTGICMVMAQSEHVAIAKAKEDYEFVLSMLLERYGDPAPQKPGAEVEERRWLGAQGTGTLIRIELQKDPGDIGHVMLSYMFSNALECERERGEGL